MPDDHPEPEYDELFGPPALLENRQRQAGEVLSREEYHEQCGGTFRGGEFFAAGTIWRFDLDGDLLLSTHEINRTSSEDLLSVLQTFGERGDDLYMTKYLLENPKAICKLASSDLCHLVERDATPGLLRAEIQRELDLREQRALEQHRERREREEEQRREKRRGYVYLAEADTGHYKIGLSKRPDERIKHFDTKMPVAVEKLHSFPADDSYAAEGTLHEWLDAWRGEGEWFDLSDKQAGRLCSITRFEGGNFYAEVPESGGEEVTWDGLKDILQQ